MASRLTKIWRMKVTETTLGVALAMIPGYTTMVPIPTGSQIQVHGNSQEGNVDMGDTDGESPSLPHESSVRESLTRQPPFLYIMDRKRPHIENVKLLALRTCPEPSMGFKFTKEDDTLLFSTHFDVGKYYRNRSGQGS